MFKQISKAILMASSLLVSTSFSNIVELQANINSLPSQAISIGDINGDNIDEQVVAVGNVLKFMKGNSDGTLTVLTTIDTEGTNMGHNAAFVQHLPSHIGFVQSESGQGLSYLGEITVASETLYRVATLIQHDNLDLKVWLLDFDKDGFVRQYFPLDYTFYGENNSHYYGFTEYESNKIYTQRTHIAGFDFNNDEFLDLAITHHNNANETGTLTILSLNSHGLLDIHTETNYFMSHYVPDYDQPIARAGDLDGDGNEDLIVGGTIYYLDPNMTPIKYPNMQDGYFIKCNDLIYSDMDTLFTNISNKKGYTLAIRKEEKILVTLDHYNEYGYFHDLFENGRAHGYSNIKMIGDINGDGYQEFTFENAYFKSVVGSQYKYHKYLGPIYIFSLIPQKGTPERFPRIELFDEITPDNGMFPANVYASYSTLQDKEPARFPFGKVSLANVDGTPYLTTSSIHNELVSPFNEKQTLWNIPFYKYSRAGKMLSFNSLQSWTPQYVTVDWNEDFTIGTTDHLTFEKVDGYSFADKSMKVTFNSGTWHTLKSTVPVTFDHVKKETGKSKDDVDRIRMSLKCRLPIDNDADYVYTYRGNIQVEVGSNWIGQFDLNATGMENVIKEDDGFYHAFHSFVLPDNVTNQLKNYPTNITLSLSAVKEGVSFIIDGITFEDADSEENRNWNKFIDGKDEFVGIDEDGIPTWEEYMQYVEGNYNGDFDSDFPAVYVTKVVRRYVNSKWVLYAVEQDVDYPMHLVEWWAIQRAYMPGSQSGPWRQCWKVVGYTNQM